MNRGLMAKARCGMSPKQTKTKPTTSRPPVKQQEDKLAYEMWLTAEVKHGPVEDRGAAEGLLLKELQRREPPKRSGNKTSRRKASK
jgi:hypothetical protein